MISIAGLTERDVNRKVVYSRSDQNAPPEDGRITSWNDTYIFVDYSNSGRGVATDPSHLSWIG